MKTVIFKTESGREFEVRATPQTIRAVQKQQMDGSPYRTPTKKELSDASVSDFVRAVRDAGVRLVR